MIEVKLILSWWFFYQAFFGSCWSAFWRISKCSTFYSCWRVVVSSGISRFSNL